VAFPIIAGSGTLTTIMSLKSTYSDLVISTGIALNLLVIFVVVGSTRYIQKNLGRSGLEVMRKFFGVILLAIAVKIFRANLF
jgi:multiple antibiotic resistance protein